VRPARFPEVYDVSAQIREHPKIIPDLKLPLKYSAPKKNSGHSSLHVWLVVANSKASSIDVKDRWIGSGHSIVETGVAIEEICHNCRSGRSSAVWRVLCSGLCCDRQRQISETVYSRAV
jgi:hypothetical protein